MSLHHANLDEYLARETMVQRYVQLLLRGRWHPVVFDIGACEGEDSIRYARAFPKGRVYSFEPLPDNQKLARLNFEKYAVYNVTLEPVALSDKAGEATFHVSSAPADFTPLGTGWNYGNKSSSLLPSTREAPMHGFISFREEIIVTCETLDGFCVRGGVRRIDFIHMDVQGAESLVLHGASKMLPHTLAIWLEVANVELYRGQQLRTNMEAFLKSRGFALLVEEPGEVEGNQLYINRRMLRGLLFHTLISTFTPWYRRWQASRTARRSRREA